MSINIPPTLHTRLREKPGEARRVGFVPYLYHTAGIKLMIANSGSAHKKTSQLFKIN